VPPRRSGEGLRVEPAFARQAVDLRLLIEPVAGYRVDALNLGADVPFDPAIAGLGGGRLEALPRCSFPSGTNVPRQTPLCAVRAASFSVCILRGVPAARQIGPPRLARH